MKNLRIVFIIFLSFLILGCGILWQRYVNKEYGFSIFLPRLWYKEAGSFGTVIMASSSQTSPQDPYRENITVTVAYLPEGMGKGTYFEMSVNQVFEMFEGKQYGVKEGTISAGGEDGQWVSFSVPAKNLILKVTSAVWIKNKRAYVVTCTCQDSEFDKYEPIFQKAMRSIRFK